MNSPLTTEQKWTEAQKYVNEYNRRFNKELQSRRGGLIHFVRYFWHVLEPSTPMVDGWPLEAICQHLEAVTFGDIKRLLITVFPGSMKSLLTDVFWPAWEWSAMGMPHQRYVAFSYSAALTERDNNRFRDLILSQDFTELWGDVFSLRKVGETLVSNNRTGWKLASSVSGQGTGHRGTRIIFDDPHSIKEAESDTVRTETVRWFREAMLNRLNNMEEDAIVIIMQRSHYDDVAGCILQNEFDYCHLSIEMEFDSSRETMGNGNEIGWIDPRTKDGELAWSERFPATVVDRLRKELGPYGFASQYQQSPVPRGGGIIQRLWWQLWDKNEAHRYGLQWEGAIKEFPAFELIVGSLDTAYEEKQEADFSALTIWGLWIDKNKNRRLMLMYAWKKRLSLHGQPVYRMPGEAKVNWEQRQQEGWGLIEHVANTCKKYKVQRLLIEAKASGISVAQEITRLYSRERWGVEMINPRGDKVARMHAVVPMFTDGMVWAPQTKWSDLVIDEIEKFPKTKYKDISDATSQVLNWLRERGLVQRADEMEAEIEAESMYRKPEESVAEHYNV